MNSISFGWVNGSREASPSPVTEKQGSVEGKAQAVFNQTDIVLQENESLSLQTRVEVISGKASTDFDSLDSVSNGSSVDTKGSNVPTQAEAASPENLSPSQKEKKGAALFEDDQAVQIALSTRAYNIFEYIHIFREIQKSSSK